MHFHKFCRSTDPICHKMFMSFCWPAVWLPGQQQPCIRTLTLNPTSPCFGVLVVCPQVPETMDGCKDPVEVAMFLSLRFIYPLGGSAIRDEPALLAQSEVNQELVSVALHLISARSAHRSQLALPPCPPSDMSNLLGEELGICEPPCIHRVVQL